ncbi:MAG: glycosyltransferase [Malacoplasma sp.]
MNILYIVPFGGTGGAEKIAINLAKNFNQDKNVKVIFLKSPLLCDTQGLNVDVVGLNSLLSIPFALFKLFILILRFKPDIVHSHLFYANFLARIFKLFFDYKLICSEHNTITKYTDFPVYFKILTKVTSKISNFNSNVSQEAVNSYISNGYYSKNEIECVYNGLDFSKFKKSLSDIKGLNKYPKGIKDYHHYKFLAVGRLHYQKNWPMMMDALQKLKVYENNFILYVVGDGPELDNIKKLIKNYNLTDNIVFLGVRGDVSDLMAICDLYLLSSYFEGLPTVLIEAMASKLNIVSTDCGGVVEILGSNKYVVENNNSDQFFKVIHEAINNDNTDLIDFRYKRASDTFDEKIMFKKWLSIYESI